MNNNIYYGGNSFKLEESVKRWFVKNINCTHQTNDISFKASLVNLKANQEISFLRINLNDIKLQQAYLKLNKALRGY